MISLQDRFSCFWRSHSFEEAILEATNLGDDADTTAAICGQSAGAFYGMQAIPLWWRQKLVMGDEILGVADRLLAERYLPA